MKRHQAFRYELRPTKAQVHLLRNLAGQCRFLYNKALGLQQERFAAGKTRLTYAQMAKLLTDWRKDPTMPWLKAGVAQTQQQALKNLEAAFVNFFEKRSELPRFKRKGDGDSIRFPQHFRFDEANGRVWLVKLGWMRYRNSRPFLGTPKNVTVSLRAGKWFASIVTEREVDIPLPEARSAVGIDMGITQFATFSTGKAIQSPHSFRKHEKALAKVQRRMDHKFEHNGKTFGANWRKLKARVSKLNARIANVRRDFLHKTTTTISKNHAMVVVEDLKVANMTRSASGTRDVPGKSVKQKSGLNKSILDQGWYEFRRQLDYKLRWNGGELIAVPPKFTSQTCPACGHVSPDNRRKLKFVCLGCGYQNHADVVGAMNVLRAGHAQIACQVNGAVMPSATGTHRSTLTIQWPGAAGVAASADAERTIFRHRQARWAPRG